MSNINRRDYLKGMAASAGVIAASKLEVFGQHSRRRISHRASTRLVPECGFPKLNWNIIETEPSRTEFATVIFSGLMGFVYDPDPRHREGRVGFHRGDGHHKLSLRVFRNPGCVPIYNANVSGAKKIVIEVLPSSTQPVAYFEQNPDQPFTRTNDHPADFRWLPDLDGCDFYPESPDRHPDQFYSWLHVKNGTFYTRTLSNSTFNLVDGAGGFLQHFGRVPRFIATAIKQSGIQFVSLQIDNQIPFPLVKNGNVTYQIVVSNECDGSCHPHDPNGPIESMWNDFHFARKVLILPPNRVEKGLKIWQKSDIPSDITDICDYNKLSIRNTDEAPCMGAGYGHDRL
jgi:hypothetical protein